MIETIKRIKSNQIKEENEKKINELRSKNSDFFKNKFKQEREERDKKEREDKIIDIIREGNEENKNHHSIWSLMFGKKGIITIALIAGIALLVNFIKKWKEGDGLAGALKSLLFGGEESSDNDTNSDKENKSSGGLVGMVKDVIEYKNPDNVMPDNSRKSSGGILTRLGVNTLL